MSLHTLHAAHVEWLGVRKTLKGQEQRFFWRWLFQQRQEIVKRMNIDAVLLQKQCREIQRGLRLPPAVGLNHTALTRYAEDLTRVYLATPIASRPTFVEWLQQVKSECLTETALRRYLGLT